MRKVLQSELFKNISSLMAGTALAQLIPILLQPLLRRYYTPELYGVYTVYLSMVGILLAVSSLRYELAIILPKKDKEAANILFISIFISLLLNLAILIILICCKSSILRFLNLNDKFSSFIYFIPLGTFLFSYYQSANYWLIRKKKFVALSTNKFLRRSTEGGTQVGFIKVLKSSFGLVWGDILGHLVNVTAVTRQVFRSEFRLQLVSKHKLRYVILKYLEYPKFNIFPSLLSACSYLVPAIMINKFYGSENAGYFDLAKLVLSIPIALIATSISNVLMQRISEKYKAMQSFIMDLIPILTVVLSVAGLEVFIIMWLGIDLFRWFFGEQWVMSGQISVILVWSFTLNFIVGSFSSVFISMGKIKLLSIWQLLYFLAILSLSLFRKLTFIAFLRTYVFIEVGCYLLFSLLIVFVILTFESNIRQTS